MGFQQGAIGVVAGAVLFVIAGLFFGATQYIYPTQAAVWFTLALVGLTVLIGAPIWFWVTRPILSRYADATHV